MEYGQFCPISKSMEILGEKWTVLIIRELLMGGRRFNELQRGLSLISPTMLSKRLDSLADYGLVLKKRIPGQKGFEYFPTESCKELLPVILSLGEWGMRWARTNLTEKDYDVELLMIYLQRSLRTDKLPGNGAVVRFKFTDISKHPDWWLVAQGDRTDVCDRDPGKDVDVFITSTVKTMSEIWMGEKTYQKAAKVGELKLVGHSTLTQSINSWMENSTLAGVPPASDI